MVPAKQSIPKIEGTGAWVSIARALVHLVVWCLATERIATLVLIAAAITLATFGWIYGGPILTSHNRLIETLTASELKQAEAQADIAETIGKQTTILEGLQKRIDHAEQDHVELRRGLDEIRGKLSKS